MNNRYGAWRTCTGGHRDWEVPLLRSAASLDPARQSVLAGKTGCRRRWLVGAAIAPTEAAAPDNANFYAEPAAGSQASSDTETEATILT